MVIFFLTSAILFQGTVAFKLALFYNFSTILFILLFILLPVNYIPLLIFAI